MLEELKKKSFKSSLVLSIVLAIAGLAMAIWQAPNVFYMLTGYVQFESLEVDEIKDQLVKIDLDTVFTYYLEEYSENTKTHQRTTTSLYYITWTGDDNATDYRYITIKVPAKYQNRMDEIAENTYNGIYSSPLTLTGKIKKLSSEDYGYFEEYFVSSDGVGWTQEEFEDYTSPYYINVFVDPASQNGVYLVVFFGGIILIAYSIFRMIKASTGGYLKSFQKSYLQAGYTEASIDADMNSAVNYLKKDAIKLGRLCIYDLQSITPRAIPVNKMLWAYQNTTTHRTNGIKTGVTYSINIYSEGHSKVQIISVPDETTAQDILQNIDRRYPWVVVGYTEDLKKMFFKDHSQFLQLRYNTVEHTTVEPGFEGFQNNYNAN